MGNGKFPSMIQGGGRGRFFQAFNERILIHILGYEKQVSSPDESKFSHVGLYPPSASNINLFQMFGYAWLMLNFHAPIRTFMLAPSFNLPNLEIPGDS